MAQVATISLTRSDGTTIDEFKPRSVSPKETILVNDRGSISQANPRLTLSFDGSKSSRKTDHANFRLNYPLERSVGDPSFNNSEVKDTAIAKVDFILPITMTSTERADLLALMQDLLSEALAEAYVKDLEPVW